MTQQYHVMSNLRLHLLKAETQELNGLTKNECSGMIKEVEMGGQKHGQSDFSY